MWKLKSLFMLLLLSTLGSSESAAQSERVSVGVILPLTGNAASYGEQFRTGMELSPASAQFQLIFEDSKFDSKTALAAYEKLTKVDKVKFVVSFGGATCEVLNRAAEQDRILHLAAGCNTARFDSKDSFNFRLDVNEAIAASKTAEYFKKSNVTKVALIHVENSWAAAIIEETKAALTRQNIETTDEVTFSETGPIDVRTQLAKLKVAKPETIFLIALPEQTPAILKQIEELRIGIPVMSNISVENPEVIRLAGANADGITYISVKGSDKSRRTFDAFYKEFPQGNPFAAWGFDSLLLLEQASQAKEPRKTLQSLDRFLGAFNFYDFDASGELSLPYELRAIKNGRYVSVEPI